MIPEEFKQERSIEEIVQIIDNGGTESQSPEELAASFAYLAAIKKENPDKEDLQMELRALMEEGARFDYPLALEYAESWLIDALNKATASQGL